MSPSLDESRLPSSQEQAASGVALAPTRGSALRPRLATRARVTWLSQEGGSREAFGDWVALGPIAAGEVEFKIGHKAISGASREKLEPDQTIWLKVDREQDTFVIQPWLDPSRP